jgi:uncharacterized protein YndB with AHSA1/START domain
LQNIVHISAGKAWLSMPKKMTNKKKKNNNTAKVVLKKTKSNTKSEKAVVAKQLRAAKKKKLLSKKEAVKKAVVNQKKEKKKTEKILNIQKNDHKSAMKKKADTKKKKTETKKKETKKKQVKQPVSDKKTKSNKIRKEKAGSPLIEADSKEKQENITPEEVGALEVAEVVAPELPLVEAEEDVAITPPPKMTKREKQIAKQLQAKAIAKARALERAKLEQELQKAAEASSRPVERSKSGRVSYKTEYVVKSSPTILFEFVTTPSGLVQWFADKVDINGDEITFNWKGSEDTALILEWVEDERVRYRWLWQEDDEFFQFRIYKNDITRDTVLEVIDFCDENEVEDQKRLWDSQIKRLIQAVGGL